MVSKDDVVTAQVFHVRDVARWFKVEREIYRGGCHYVTCDWHVHRAYVPGRSMEIQCRCFCEDQEFKTRGFSTELMERYR